MKSINARLITGLAVFIVICLGLAFDTGLGTFCSFGLNALATVCPLGAFQAFLAGKSISISALIGLGIVVVLVVLFGRAGCSWFCAVPTLRRIFGGKKAVLSHHGDAKEENATCEEEKNARLEELISEHGKRALDEKIDAEFAQAIAATCSGKGCASCKGAESEAKGTGKKKGSAHRFKTSSHDVRLPVLIGSLASAAIVGFPVFCLLCPIGLTVGTVVGLWRLFALNQATWMLIVMPALLVVELVVLKKWCHRLCPVGALFSLGARANKTFRPTVDPEKCLRLTGQGVCHSCYSACPEGIDLQDLIGGVSKGECTKCRSCIDACPQHCISMPAVSKGTSIKGLSMARAKSAMKAYEGKGEQDVS